MGNRPAKLAELDTALTVIRGLLAGERVTQTWLGQEREIEFLDKNGHWYNLDAPVDVWMSAGGPEGLRARGQARGLRDLLPRARTPR